MGHLTPTVTHIIVESFNRANYTKAWAYINATINSWEADDWDYILEHVPITEELVFKHVRHYRTFEDKIQRFNNSTAFSRELHDKLGVVWRKIRKIIAKCRKEAEHQYYLNRLALAC